MIAMGAPKGGPDAATDSTAAGNSDTEQCVPLDALAEPDDQEQMAAPEVGDSVNYQVQGKVTRIEGNRAYVEPESINGKPVDDGDEQSEGEAGEQGPREGDYSQLEDQANQMGGL